MGENLNEGKKEKIGTSKKRNICLVDPHLLLSV